MTESIYTDGKYLETNPTWHVEDSAWKAAQILRMLERNRIRPQTVCEVGCGAGEILKRLQEAMDRSCEFHGYEISPQAFRLCQERANDRLHFHLQDFLLEEERRFDLLLLIDVIEHMEDYFGFLRRVRSRSHYTVLHIPLDLSCRSVLWPSRLLEIRRTMGHIHCFTFETAMESLVEAGYKVIDHFLTPVALDAPKKAVKTHLANVPRRITSIASRKTAARLFGGFSLLVLAT